MNSIGGVAEGVVPFWVALVVPVLVGLWVYFDANRSNLPYSGPWAYGIAALWYAGLLSGLFGVAAYSSYKRYESGSIV